MSVIILNTVAAKILIIDHNDSFTYNLVGLFESLAGENGQVASVDVWSVDDLPGINLQLIWQFDAIVLSPGPGLPKDYPAVSVLLRECLEGVRKMPVLGICLGLQSLAVYYGGVLYNLPLIQHGRQADLLVRQENTPRSAAALFAGLQLPVKVGLYHSWGMDNSVSVKALEVLATASISESSSDGKVSGEVVMAIGHKQLPVYGLQFHPESYMTPEGGRIIRNWLDMIEALKR